MVLAAVMSDEQEQPRDRSEPDAQADGEDIRASLDGDGEAFGRLIQRYQQPIAAYLWRFTRQRQVWEELIQDVFVEAFLSLRGYRADAPLLHWLKRIATRVGYRHWRTRQAQRCELPISTAEAVTGADQRDAPSRCEAGEFVYSLLSRLSPRDRLVMTLVYLEECSPGEIAQRTGWSVALVKVQTHRARKRLKKLCEREGIEL
jgi:RNA polymerase sigma-70 factor (ECF subfamily)